MTTNETNTTTPGRTLPMRVLLLGLPRTNTTSLTSALRTLGYTPYTMRALLQNPSHIPTWHAALESTRHAPGLPLPINDILSPYDAVADLPGCIFATQLISAYPDARVILTTRRYEAWEASMQESIWVLLTWRLFEVCRITGVSRVAPLVRLLYALFGAHNGNTYGGCETRRAYERHNERVRELVSRERLLEIDAEDEVGWSEICGFLGVERPVGKEYPRVQEDTAMRAGLEQTWWSMVRYLALMVVLPGFVLVVGALLYVYADELRAVRDENVFKPLKTYLDGDW